MVKNLNTFYNSYKTLKQSLRSKLSDFNISVNSSMGLTTLINKVRDITSATGVTKSVSILWTDNGNSKMSRPSEVKVNLVDSGKVLDSITLSSSNGWQGVFTNAPSSAIVDVDNVPTGYTKNLSGNGNQTTIYLHYPLGNLNIELIFNFSSYGLPDSDSDYRWASDVGSLQVGVVGPDSSCPITLTYNQFTNEAYSISNVDVGTYTVAVINAESNFEAILGAESAQGAVVLVSDGGTGTARLVLDYTGVNGESGLEEDDSLTEVEVTMMQDDNNNSDGNRPSGVVVHLYGGGIEVGSQTLNSSNGWRYTFTDLQRFNSYGKQISYTVTPNAVSEYITYINGFAIRQVYQRTEVALSVRKIWDDNNNASNLRPSSIYMTLSNGQRVFLMESNNWQASISGLPMYVNGQLATYTWTEQSVNNYVKTGETTSGNVTTFTNTVSSQGGYDAPL